MLVIHASLHVELLVVVRNDMEYPGAEVLGGV